MLVPVKQFTVAKGRLAGVLGPEGRAELARWMAARVLDAVAELPTFVACDDPDVRDWAVGRGAHPLWGPGLGLNGAVDDGVAHIAQLGYDHVLIAHADLPRPAALAHLARPGAVTLVPDRRRDGTNVMALPLPTAVNASYGGGSFARHLAQALQLGSSRVEVCQHAELSLDVDHPADLAHPLINEVLPAWLRTNPVSRTST